MKSKLLFFSLIAVLLFSALNVTLAKDECPTCNGTGRITTSQQCLTCLGSGVSEPTITRKRTFAWGSEPSASMATFISGIFQNEEDIGAYGIVTAEVKTPTVTYTNTSARTYFPPHEDINVTIMIEGLKFEPYWSCSIYLSQLDSAPCPDCNGTGVVSTVIYCPECGGTGYITAGIGGGNNFLVVGGAVVGVAVAAAVAITAVVVVRRKRVSEENLRKLSPSEFQNWVVQRLFGKGSSPKDSYMGIDGYTAEGHPIQAKQSDDIGRNEIESFVTAMGRSKAKKGIIVAFSFGKDAYVGKVRAKVHYNREIQLVTVKELMERRNRPL